MATATLVQDNLKNFNGHAALYRLSEPIAEISWDYEYPAIMHDFVVVSTVSTFGLETYIFPADETGKVIAWGELSGSRKGTSSHAEVLQNAGYELTAA